MRKVTSSSSTPNTVECWYQTRANAVHDAHDYLRHNMMPFDISNMETLGFPKNGTQPADEADGLGNGLIGPTIELALDAKIKHHWADRIVPKEIYFEYVLNYANVNEGRTNWRPLLTDAIESMLNDHANVDSRVNDVVRIINARLWNALGRRSNESIVFQSGQTPLIFDPMSTIAFGYCSCTGTAILFTNALRAAGIPARVVGTPAWKGERSNGNHNWVEVYRNGKWDFMEPSTPTDPSTKVVVNPDDLDRNPCDRWFCHANQRYGDTRVYAARLDRSQREDDDGTHYVMAWEWDSKDVPGEDRTDYYIEKCNSCE